MKTIVYSLISFMLMVSVFSCTVDDNLQNSNDEFVNNGHIKSISYNKNVIQIYHYDNAGKITEDNSMYFYNRYLYNENGHLVKIETAVDEQGLLSNSVYVGKSELMNADNSTINSYKLFKYDGEGRLSKIENYYKKDGENFELRSLNSYEYKGVLIIKENLHDDTGEITQFHEFTYDNAGNVTNDKYYSQIGRSNPELISETSYQYDNYKNPFRILSILGSPGFYTNINNIIETTSTLYLDVPGVDKYTNSKRTYEYNTNGYPVKLTTKDSEERYEY